MTLRLLLENLCIQFNQQVVGTLVEQSELHADIAQQKRPLLSVNFGIWE